MTTKQNKPILVFDLDETMINSVIGPTKEQIEECFIYMKEDDIAVFKRNQLIEFLQKLYSDNRVELALFTAATQPYADYILFNIEQDVFEKFKDQQPNEKEEDIFKQKKKIDIKKEKLLRQKHRDDKWDQQKQKLSNKKGEVLFNRDYIKYRVDCSTDESGSRFKDLEKFKKFSDDRFLIVDDVLLNFKNQPRNGIAIRPFEVVEGKNDIELLKLYIYLQTIDTTKPLNQQNIFLLIE